MRLNVEVLSKPVRIVALLTGYAYETVADTPIIAGATSGPDAEVNPQGLAPGRAPATLGLLAMGAPGMSIWRREESVDAMP